MSCELGKTGGGERRGELMRLKRRERDERSGEQRESERERERERKSERDGALFSASVHGTLKEGVADWLEGLQVASRQTTKILPQPHGGTAKPHFPLPVSTPCVGDRGNGIGRVEGKSHA